MYEAEANNTFESIETVPIDVRQRFAESRHSVIARTTLPWGEHCTECAWPVCYTTCELYSPRMDGECRQFVDGMVRIDHKDGLNPYLLKLRFKGWAKLWTVGNLHLRPLAEADSRERLNIAIGALSRNVPVPNSIKPQLLRKVSYIRRQAAENAPPSPQRPDSFMLECYNPNSRDVTLTFTIRIASDHEPEFFQRMILVAPGYNRARIKFCDISQVLDLRSRFEVEIVPNNCLDCVLYFGVMDFVKEHALREAEIAPNAQARKWKCIVWDLDNTLWDGILVEDGPDSIRIRQDVVDVIRETDQRGILHSIASKNNADAAMELLRTHDLMDYFLHPQIGWRPKSEGVARIAALLNIGVDSLAFVDDQAFEREEVRSALPGVVVVDAADSLAIPQRAECQVPVTVESMSRRSMYRDQEGRTSALASHGGDYLTFLRDCHLELDIGSLDERNVRRVYELAQRTNQMNFSGNRYPEEHLREVMVDRNFETCVIACTDRFGDYGIVGFALVDWREPRLLDLMFSCRVQAKRVEHAVLAFLLHRFAGDRQRDFFANFRRTPKNEPSGRVFEELGFERAGEADGVSSLVFRSVRAIPDDGIIAIRTRQADTTSQPQQLDGVTS